VPDYCYVAGDPVCMARRGSNGGRPSKGDRELFATRLPVELAELVRDDADRSDLSLSEHLANLVAQHYERPLVAVARPPQQERLIA